MVDFLAQPKRFDKLAAEQLTSIAGNRVIAPLVDQKVGVHVKHLPVSGPASPGVYLFWRHPVHFYAFLEGHRSCGLVSSHASCSCCC